MLLRALSESEGFEPSSSEENNKLKFEVEIFNCNTALSALEKSTPSDPDYGDEIKYVEHHLRYLKMLVDESKAQNFAHTAESQRQYLIAVETARKIWRSGKYSIYTSMHNRPHVWPDETSTGGMISGVVVIPEWLKQPLPKSYTIFVHQKNILLITRMFYDGPVFSIGGVIPGEYVVSIKAQGYKSHGSAKQVIVQAGQDVKIKFSMELD